VAEGTDAIVMKLLAIDPTVRYGSADKLIEDLGWARAGRLPVTPFRNELNTTAPADGAAQTLKLPASEATTGNPAGIRRRRVFSLLTALASLAAVLGIGGWSLLRDGVPGTLGGKAGKPPPAVEGARAGHEEVQVPPVRGLREQAARKRLEDVGFRVEVRRRESPEQATGQVLEQSVAGGEKAREGSQIVLTVGEGPRVARVPDLVGLNYSEAEYKLKQAGYLLGGVEEASSETVPAGVIASQDPQVGSTLERGSWFLCVPYDEHRACG
jgi:PASTA domain